MNFFVRKAVEFKNNQAQATSALLGIVQGVLADGELNDAEIRFLSEWLTGSDAMAAAWPGNVLRAKIQESLRDGCIDPQERQQLVVVLQQLVGGSLEDLAQQQHVSELPLDRPEGIDIGERVFCLTGDFAFGHRDQCVAVIERLGGRVAAAVSKKVNYLVVGGLGSTEWKHGSFGAKVVKAMELKQAGACIQIVHEDLWAAAVMGY